MLTKADIKLVRSLADRAERAASGLFVVEGAKMVHEALESDMHVERVFATRGTGIDWGARLKSISAEEVSPAEMERLSHMKTPPGLLALVRIPERRFNDAVFGHELILALDGVQDPGNLGTIIRIADWFGIGGIVCSPGSADCYNPKVVQATMGALFRIAVHYLPLPGFLSSAVSSGTQVFATALEGEDIYHAHLPAAGVVVMGSESHGVSPQVLSLIPRKLFIPPYPAGRQGSESLNVATATAIICSEFRRMI